MDRFDCLKLLAEGLITDDMLVTTSLSTNTSVFASLRKSGAGFYGLNMGLCTGFAVGLSLAFPNRKVVALDSDGSFMEDTSVLITIGDLDPKNLVVIVFDNQAYARMGPTATSRNANLEAMAQGAGLETTRTVRTLEEFESAVTTALRADGPTFIVAKVEAETVRARATNPRRTYGRAMREAFIDEIMKLPDYRGPDAIHAASD
ncbi:MAG TPA: thiamine pyrophosphate-dependent enzyme [Bryobacteraceae bacterium]|nr:thiamine pyrophosphate-dependent enzyme [Bryobacteraceae bacterium]